jgi:hypothetical protein
MQMKKMMGHVSEENIPFIRNRLKERKSILQDHENLGDTKVDLFI